MLLLEAVKTWRLKNIERITLYNWQEEKNLNKYDFKIKTDLSSESHT